MEINFSRKILLAFKVALFIIGFTLGFLAIYQILDTYEDMVKSLPLRIMFYAASSLVPAAALTFSAKGCYRIFDALSKKIIKGANTLRLQDLAAVLLSAIVGTLFGYVSDIVLGLFFNILALRLVFDILIALIVIYGMLILTFKWLRLPEKSEVDEASNANEADEVDEAKEGDLIADKVIEFEGYLLTLSALKNPRAYTLFSKLLIGRKFILDELDDSPLLSNDETALKNLSALKADGCIEYALDEKALKKLKPVVQARQDIEELLINKEVVLVLEEL